MRVNDEFKLTFIPKCEGKYPLTIIHSNSSIKMCHILICHVRKLMCSKIN